MIIKASLVGDYFLHSYDPNATSGVKAKGEIE